MFIGVRAIFWRGLDRFCPKNMGQRPKNECLIPKCSDFGHFILPYPTEYFSCFSFIICKMLFFIFGRCPKNCSIALKNYFARLWGLQPPQSPPSSYAYANVLRMMPVSSTRSCLTTMQYVTHVRFCRRLASCLHITVSCERREWGTCSKRFARRQHRWRSAIFTTALFSGLD